ncbi:MAG TPA: flagellar hook-associated protein [Mariprofundaceae bacterium]|nr:flagellar hook-associated protein [Mariprofundaceae bacterium]
MPPITGLSGIVAGFDTGAAVEELLGLQKFGIAQLEKKQAAETAKQDAYNELNTNLRDFRNQAIAMRDIDTFFSYTASLNSSDAAVPASTILDVAGDNSVTSGNHAIVVQQLAATARSSSNSAVKDASGTAIINENTALNFSTGSFQVNGTTINVSAADSLKDIANSINTAETGVTATVVKVNDSDFRLVLAADDTGITGFTLTGVDLDAAGPLANLNIGAIGQPNATQVLQPPLDAIVTIDGLTITRSSNTIGDAISGLTFTLKQADPATTVNMVIGVDTVDVRSKVQAFVDSYNAVYGFINDQFKVNAETQQNGVLASESILTSIQSNLSSGLLKSVPGLASDRNSLVKIGIEPDEYGVLGINDDLFTNFLNNDSAAIRDVFVAQGSSATPGMQFLVAGDNTLSGSYAINVTTLASKASATGNVDVLSTPLVASQTVSFTEAGNLRQANIDLLAGDTQSNIIAKMNTEFSKVSTEARLFDQLLLDSSTSLAANGGTSFANIGGVLGETIIISGTNRSGVAINQSFSIIDPNLDTISDLLSAIQSAFNQRVTASIDASGRIQVKDNTAGDSQLTLSLTSSGALNFGVDTTPLTTEGRYAMSLEAVASGNFVSVQHKYYGANKGFEVSGAATALGIPDTAGAAITGTDIAGTINGETTTGSGQVLVGNAGGADGIAVLYSGNTAPPFTSNMTIGMGIAASFDGILDLYANPFTGLIQNSMLASEDTYTTLSQRIDDLNIQLEKQRLTLTRSFLQMEQAMNSLNATGDFLTQQVDALNSNN